MRFFAIILLSLLICLLMYSHLFFLSGVSPALMKYVLIIFILIIGLIFYLIYKEPVIKFKLIQTGILDRNFLFIEPHPMLVSAFRELSKFPERKVSVTIMPFYDNSISHKH